MSFYFPEGGCFLEFRVMEGKKWILWNFQKTCFTNKYLTKQLEVNIDSLSDQSSERTLFFVRKYIPWCLLSGLGLGVQNPAHTSPFLMHLFWAVTYCSCNRTYYRKGTVRDLGTFSTKHATFTSNHFTNCKKKKKKKWTGHLDRCNFKTTWVPHNLPCGCPSNTSPVNEVPVSPFSTKEQKDVPTKALATFIQALVIWLLNYFQSDYEEQLYFVDIPPIFK